MPILRIAPLAALALLLTTGSASAATSCGTLRDTVAKNKLARVYQVRGKHGAIKELRTYGCWLATGRRLRLDERCDQEDLSPEGDDACRDEPSIVRLRGRHVALEYSSFYGGEGGESFTTIVRANLHSGRRDEAVRLDNNSDSEIGPFVIRLFLSKRGGIAYSAEGLNE